MCTYIINIVFIDNINGIQEYLCPIYCELWVGHENSRQESLISYRLTFSETRDTWSHPACDNCDMIYVCVNTNWTELWRKSMRTKDTTDKLNPISRIRTTYLIRDKSCLEIFVSPWDERELMSKSTYLTSITIYLPTYLGVMKIKV